MAFGFPSWGVLASFPEAFRSPVRAAEAPARITLLIDGRAAIESYDRDGLRDAVSTYLETVAAVFASQVCLAVEARQFPADWLDASVESFIIEVALPHLYSLNLEKNHRAANLRRFTQIPPALMSGRWYTDYLTERTRVLAAVSPTAAMPPRPIVTVGPHGSVLAGWLEGELNTRGWTVHDLQGHNGPNYKTARRILNGERPRRGSLEKIAQALSVPLSQIPTS